MSQCPGQCSTCQTEIKQERHQRQIEARHLHSCQAGSMLTVEEVFEDLPDFIPNVEEDEEEDSGQGPEIPEHNLDELEGDRVFMTTIWDPPELIRASATTSQRLSDAFAKNSTGPKAFWDSVDETPYCLYA